jgi:ubiquinol-cytochrome c reductase cytochrome c1 subunit
MTMMRTLALATVASLGLMVGGASASEGTHVAEIEDFAFSYEGPFGKFDRNQLQRGLQVYTEVCSACHGLQFVAIRTLGDEGGPELSTEKENDQVRAYAATLEVIDADTGEARPAVPADRFPGSQLEGAPDLSVMAKARKGFSGPYGLGINQMFRGIGGPEYIASLLTGYTGEEKEEAGELFYENKAFSTGWIKMPPPLEDGLVTFADGSPNDMRSMSQDLAAFLMWTAEPKLMARKEAGLIAVLFLSILGVLLYLTNKRLWAGLKGRKQHPAE